MSIFQPIHHTFGPHATTRFCVNALQILCAPWKWQVGKSTKELRTILSDATGADTFLFSSGREALLSLLRAIDLQPGDEIIIQGYTCVALPNAIHEAGGVPVFADIDPSTLNLDCADVEKRISNRTRAIICQHTFGIPSDTDQLRRICDQNAIALIEDCAHIIPDGKGPHAVAEKGDFILLSFGRDKALSGVTGGALLSKHSYVSDFIKEEESKARSLSKSIIGKLLLYPFIYVSAKPFYGVIIGKAFLRLMKTLGLLVPIVSDEEKTGSMDAQLHSMPNACAFLAVREWDALHEMNEHRRALTQEYLRCAEKYSWSYPSAIHADLPLQKFPVFVEDGDSVRRTLKKKNIHLDDGWTGSTVCPASVQMQSVPYPIGQTPQASAVCTSIVSLPTHPTMLPALIRNVSSALSDALHFNNV